MGEVPSSISFPQKDVVLLCTHTAQLLPIPPPVTDCGSSLIYPPKLPVLKTKDETLGHCIISLQHLFSLETFGLFYEHFVQRITWAKILNIYSKLKLILCKYKSCITLWSEMKYILFTLFFFRMRTASLLFIAELLCEIPFLWCAGAIPWERICAENQIFH